MYTGHNRIHVRPRKRNKGIRPWGDVVWIHPPIALTNELAIEIGAALVIRTTEIAEALGCIKSPGD
jgi:hypothetical protein